MSVCELFDSLEAALLAWNYRVNAGHGIWSPCKLNLELIICDFAGLTPVGKLDGLL